MLALVVGIVAVFFASPSPDGLERVAEDKGFIEAAQDAPFEIIPDYVRLASPMRPWPASSPWCWARCCSSPSATASPACCAAATSTWLRRR